MLRQILLYRLYAFYEQLNLALLMSVLRYLDYVLELVGIGLREIERELCAGGADELIEHARRENYRFERTARFAAERSRTHSGKTYRNARLRDKSKAEVVADETVFLCYEAAEERARVFADYSHEEIAYADNDERHAAYGRGTVKERAEVEIKSRTHEEQQKYRRAEIIELLE